MTDIAITDLTNKTEDEAGTGIFDLLMVSANLQIENQFDEGRLTGAEFAEAYVSILQGVMQQSIQFLLSEQEAGKKADLIDAQITESISDTSRKDATALLSDALIREKTESEALQNVAGGILDKQLADIIAATLLKTSQNLEVVASTIRNGSESVAKIDLLEEQVISSAATTARNLAKNTSDISVNAEQISASQSDTTRSDSDSTSKRAVNTEQIAASQATTTRNNEKVDSDILVNSEQVTASIASTIRSNNDSVSKIALNAEQVTASQANTTRENAESVAKVDLTEQQIVEITEKIDLIIGQTAEAYANITATEAKTVRDNQLSNSEIAKQIEETDLLKSKDLEELANTVRQDAETRAKVSSVNADVAVKSQEEYMLRDKNGDASTNYTYYTDGVSGGTSTSATLGGVKGSVIGAVTSGGTNSVIDLDKAILIAKDALIAAQTNGFTSDTKQKVLKQLQDGFAVVYATLGGGPDQPTSNQKTAIDNLVTDILENA